MPKTSKNYCKNTPINKMGFTQRSSCRAQGLIPRADGTTRKSAKYRMKELPLDVTSKIFGYISGEEPTQKAREILKTGKVFEKLTGIPTEELLREERETFEKLTYKLHKQLNKKDLNFDKIIELVKKGASPNTIDNDGYPVIYYAVSFNNLPLLKELLVRDAMVNFVDNNGNTLLHIAVLSDNPEMIKMLNIRPNYNNEEEMTPLNLACMRPVINMDVVKELLRKGANPDDGSIDYLGESDKVYKLLFSLGARPMYYDDYRQDLEELWDEMDEFWKNK